MSNYKELREAFVYGARAHGAGMDWAKQQAAMHYPAPKVERPRVVTLYCGTFDEQEYRLFNGRLQWRKRHQVWQYDELDRDSISALLDLFDHPTELVEVDE